MIDEHENLRSAIARSAALEAVIHHMVEGVVMWNEGGKVVSMNNAALRIFGFATFEEAEVKMADAETLFEQSYADGRQMLPGEWPISRAMRGEVVSGMEIAVRRRDNGRSWIGSFNAAKVESPSGGTAVVVLTISDITDRKRAESQLQEAQAKLSSHARHLEALVRERTATLQKAVDQMEEFSYTVSHDLRAPLRSIKVYSEILLKDFGRKLTDDGRNYLERIVKNASGMEQLMNDILAVSRMARTDFRLEKVPLGEVLAKLLQETIAFQPPKAAIDLKPLPPVLGQRSLLAQVFGNLLGNAVKFVPPGRTPEVRVWAEQDGRHVRIWVEDNGIGIEAPYREKIFGLFERLNPERAYGGSGVGLTIVRKVVERMEGAVGVESDGKNGSRFWVNLLPAP